MKVRRWLWGGLATLGAVVLVLVGVAGSLWARQGLDPSACPVEGVSVEVDAALRKAFREDRLTSTPPSITRS